MNCLSPSVPCTHYSKQLTASACWELQSQIQYYCVLPSAASLTTRDVLWCVCIQVQSQEAVICTWPTISGWGIPLSRCHMYTRGIKTRDCIGGSALDAYDCPSTASWRERQAGFVQGSKNAWSLLTTTISNIMRLNAFERITYFLWSSAPSSGHNVVFFWFTIKNIRTGEKIVFYQRTFELERK